MANIHFRTALDYARRSPFQALAAIFVLALTFFVGTLLAVLVYSSGKALSHFETRPQIIAFLKDDVTAEEISSFQNTLNKDSRVKDVAYVSKEEALEIYKDATADNPLLSELVSPSIFPASLEFSLTDLNFAEEVINEVKKISLVDQVGFTASLGGESTLGDVVTRLRTITWYVRIGGAVFVGLLVGTSLLVLLVIITMRITTRRGEMEILSLIGATKKFIRSPIIMEALIYAFVGVFLGWIFALILVLYATPGIVSYFGEIPVLPRDTVQLFILMGIILAVEIVVGVSLALFGSTLAISRVRRRK
ncbi:permease-like cell division protein FtsX [Patescibacteria group bacterium]|nr:permease-like cell division protein FtsX [Patescibacteria group bacterium]MBU0846308.1 permease-like cell division protein FtsX [Patescibacteria group bacterium]MBU0922572.1 permease-like cell division protein FtsX [Patescibacteria group bacterium]MBU1066623.1 permease-like cell division protein FtsX [Patescibacteria group bacterium]MBU1845116.1 permease-like cell division protein FtsX [Patescibacteria group bacterium]